MMRAFSNGLLFFACTLTPVVLAQETGGGWNELDQDLDEVLLTNQTEPWLPNVSGFVRADARFTTRSNMDEELGDFRIYNANLVLAGAVGDTDTSYRVSYEMGEARTSDPGTLEDAYLTFSLPAEFKATFGQFKAPVLRSGLVEDDRTLFFMHSYLGSIFEARDRGIMLEGDWEFVRGTVAIQNGIDEDDTEHAFIGRVAVDLAGEGVPLVEGAYGAPGELSASVAAAVLDDESISDGVLLAFEAAVTYDRLAVAAELVTADDGYDEAAVVNSGDPRSVLGEATPWGVTVSYMLGDQVEAGYRVDFLDTPDNAHLQTFGATYYLDGHDLKWQVGLTLFEPEGRDEHILGAGLSASF